jgi:hypothetical protein
VLMGHATDSEGVLLVVKYAFSTGSLGPDELAEQQLDPHTS